MGVNGIAIFCEDIREEKSGQITLIGILPDNLNLNSLPGLGPKLGIYVRLAFDAKSPRPKEIAARLQTPWSEDRNFEIGHADADLIGASAEASNSSNLPVAGIVMQALISPFPIPTAGQIVVYIKVDGEERPCGVLNLIGPSPTSSNEQRPQT